MTEAPNTVSGLLTKRAELVKLRGQLEAELRGLTCDIDHIDGCIRLFDPANAPAARKRYATKHRAKKGQMVRFVLGALREASGPLTSRQIAEAWVAERGLRTDDGTLVVIRKRVGTCLIALRAKGLARDAGRVGESKGWQSAATSEVTKPLHIVVTPR
jgi:hypothetical protein